jgi:hypothetical protein
VSEGWQHEQHYDIEDANELLPWVSETLKRAQAIANRLADEAAAASQHGAQKNGKVHHNGVHHTSSPAEELSGKLAELTKLGIVVRDLRTGLIDFPSIQNGREVYLCWRLGEPLKLQWWHDLNTGFGGRQPL